MFKRILLSCVLCISGIPATAQTTSTEVLGTVTDTSGGVIVNARIALLRVDTGERRLAVSDTSGNYSFPLIEIGDYTVSVEAQGFKTQTQDRH